MKEWKKGRDELWEKGRASEGWKKERKEGRIFKFLCLPSGGRPPTSFSSISLFFLRALFSLFSWVTWLLQNNSKLRLTSYIIHHLKQVVYDKRFQSKYLMRWAYIMEGKKQINMITQPHSTHPSDFTGK